MHDAKALDVRKLVKVYKNGVRAVGGVSFDVGEGEIFGILGPNGAGKSTVIKTLVTLIGYSGGSISVSGIERPDGDPKIRQLIGYVPQDISADGALSGEENMILSARLHGLRGQRMNDKISDILEMLGLSGSRDRLVSTYSGGMIRKLEIAQALIHTPKIIFLDEPTVGLDPIARDAIWKHIKELRDKFGVTVVITTHYMEEADLLCDRIAIMNRGRIVALGSPAGLKSRVGGSSIIFGISGGSGISIKNMKIGRDRATVKSSNPEMDVPKYLGLLSAKGVSVNSMKVNQTTLNDVFIKFTGSTIQDEERGWSSTRKTRKTAGRLG